VVDAALFSCTLCVWRLAGEILVGFSSDDANGHEFADFTSAARYTLWAVTGADVRFLVFRGKFVFIGQVGSPQIAAGTHVTGTGSPLRDMESFQNRKTLEGRKSSEGRL